MRTVAMRLAAEGMPLPHADTLLETVGTTHFHEAFLKAAQAALGASHVAAFAVDPAGAPEIIMVAEEEEPTLGAYAASRRYVERYWRHDALSELSLADAELSRGVLVHTGTSMFARLAHRRACYCETGWSRSGGRLVDRLSLLKRTGHGLVRIDFYRTRDRGGFTPADIGTLREQGWFFASLVARHRLAAVPARWTEARPAIQNLIERIAPDMPRREVQVCAGIIFGLSSEAIALEIGIGRNTVMTYRKRAYARLNISSQHELLRAVYSAAATVGPVAANRHEAPARWALPLARAAG
ncbi:MULTISPECIES: helix-turn-helix transcriptional regulator [Chelativorans]|uniref:Transcriptional regulator, LuxR family n=1 Tax=Chelativorans sp. (strain BNC1) TaxID=266779 RepID=Q11K75_CHESB|nr:MULTISPECIES: LuxR C-terminal-related transcriptional regulator [Chelativorans]